jgi:hypothetical protein
MNTGVFLFGSHHHLLEAARGHSTHVPMSERMAFERELRRVQQVFQIDAIAEVVPPYCDDTLTRALAEELGLLHGAIDLSIDARVEQGLAIVAIESQYLSRMRDKGDLETETEMAQRKLRIAREAHWAGEIQSKLAGRRILLMLSGDHTSSVPDLLAERGIPTNVLHECWGAAWRGNSDERWVSAIPKPGYRAKSADDFASTGVSGARYRSRAEDHSVIGHFLNEVEMIPGSLTLVQRTDGRLMTDDGHEAHATESTIFPEMVIVELAGNCPRTFIATAYAIERSGLRIFASRIRLN